MLLARIIGNTEKLNEAMLELNRALACVGRAADRSDAASEISVHNGNIEAVEAVWSNLTRNVRCARVRSPAPLTFADNLESSQSLEDPK